MATVLSFRELNAQDVVRCILRHARTISPHAARCMGKALRSLLRFLHERGDIATNLAAFVPSVAKWSLAGLPKFLSPQQVELVLKKSEQGPHCGSSQPSRNKMALTPSRSKKRLAKQQLLARSQWTFPLGVGQRAGTGSDRIGESAVGSSLTSTLLVPNRIRSARCQSSSSTAQRLARFVRD
jgi:hypothetical protein